MAKQLNVNLAFTADTGQAKQQLQQLQQQLNSLIAGSPAKQLGFDTEINKGIDAAARLKLALQEATNATTGKLDLGKFDQQIKKSGMTIKEYGANLAALGPKGQEAFMSLARSVSNAEIPLTRVNSKITELGVVLKNTLKWQISSSVLHGFMSAVSGAYQYAQDLNESLNNIRIVTGQSADQMDRFAEKANKAAKALNATTTEYSNAALIYYQQGLSDDDVLKRTNTTIKLANVSRESAETVSEWMTAIWNNFDNGTRSLESYADTITALGAATASSADEIAEGLEKFSAIAETVGLSYDYATAALATVTSQTRQSADLVGTAFKTLFARLEGLKLGESLEDGVTLNHYSEGLAAVGINIKNANGELKDMDTILDQLGSRWDTLSKAQQVALAQTVGGIRQYNQLISLMDNWDTFQQNLTIAQTSEGALQEQADIYAESWEGAQKRVKASAEAIYSNLLDDDFFIDLLNGFSHILDTINSLIDSLGGAKGVLLAVSTLLLQMTGPKIAKGLETMALNMKYFLNPTKAQADAKAIKDQMWKTASVMSTDTGTQAGAAQGAALQQEAKLQRYLLENASKMSETEQAIYKLRMDNVRALQEANVEHAKAVDLLDKQKELASVETARSTETGQSANSRLTMEQAGDFGVKFKSGATGTLEKVHVQADTLLQMPGLSDMNLTDAQAKIMEFKTVFDKMELELPKEISEAEKAINEALNKGEKGRVSESSAKKEVRVAENDARTKGTKLRGKMEKSLGKEGLKALDKEVELRRKATEANEKYEKSTKHVNKAADSLIKTSKKGQQTMQSWSTTTVQVAQGISSLAMGLSMGVSIFNNLSEAVKDGEMTFSDFLGIIMSLGMGIPMIKNGIATLITGLGQLIITTTAASQAQNTYSSMTMLLGKAIKANNQEKAKEILMTQAGLTADEAALVIQNKDINTTWQQAAAKAGLNLQEKFNTTNKNTNTIATWLNKIAQDALNGSIGATLTLLALFTVAIGVVVGLVFGAVAAWKAWQASTVEGKLKAEQQALTDLNKSLEEAKTRYNDLKAAVEEYGTAKSAIEAMIEGTDEWKTAVSELNDQVLQLMETYPELSQYVKMENGVLTIKEEDLDKVLSNAANSINELENSVIAQRISVEEKKSAVDLKSNKSNLGYTYYDSDTGMEYTTLKGNNGQIANLSGSQGETERFYSQMQNLYDKFGDELFTSTENQSQELKEAIGNMSSSWQTALSTLANDSTFQQIVTSNKDLSDKISQLSLVMAANTLENNEIYQNSKYKDAIGAQYSDAFAKAIEDRELKLNDGTTITKDDWFKNYLIKNFNENDGTNGSVQSNENIKKAGLEGITNQEDLASWIVSQKTGIDVNQIGTAASNQVQLKQIGGDTIKYKGPDDDEWKSIDYEDYQEQLWSKYVNQELDKQVASMSANAKQYANDLLKIGMAENAVSSAIKDYVSGNTINLSNLTREQVYSMDTSKFEDENLKQAMDTAIQEYETALRDANLQASQAWVENTAAREATELQNAISAAKMDTDDFDDYVKALQTAHPELIGQDELTKKLAKDNLQLTNSLASVEKSLEENAEALSLTDKESAAYVSAINDISQALKEWLGVKLDDKVIAQFQEDGTLQAAINGSAEAIDKLQDAAAEQIVLDMNIKGLTNEYGINYFDVLNNKINELSNKEIKIGATLEDLNVDKFIETLNEMLATGAVTAEQMNGYLNSIGYEPDITYTETKQDVTTKGSVSVGPLTIPYEYTTEQSVKIPVINGKETTYTGGGSKTSTPATAETDKSKLDSKTKNLKSLNDEVDRYHEIEEVIDDLSKEMDKLSKAKDRAFGKDKVKAMMGELDVLDAQIAAQDTLIEKTKSYLNTDKQNLLNLNSNVKIDDTTGNITNYEEIQQDYLSRLANMDPDSAQYEILNSEYELFKDYVSKYEETYDKYEEAVENKADLAYEKLTKKLEAIDYSLEFNIEIDDRKLDNLKRKLEELDDDQYDGAARIKNLNEQAGVEVNKINNNEKALKETLRAEGVSEKDIESYMGGNGNALDKYNISDATLESIKKYTDNITDGYQALKEIRTEVEENVMTTFRAWHDEIEENGRAFEHATSMAESYKNIIDLVGKDALGLDDSVLEDLEYTAAAAAKGNMANAKTQMETTQTNLNTAKEKLADAQKGDDEDAIEYWKNVVEELDNQLMEDQENFMTSWQDALQVAADNFTAKMDRAFENLEDNLAGSFKSFEEMEAAMDQAETVSDRFLDNGKKQYELSKLNRKLQQDLAKTTSIKGQEELLAIQREIEELQASGAEMSKYDLEALQKKYDLKLAEIALEDAQNAKKQVRLRQDSEGNFGYVYTADQTAVADAAQNYEDELEENRQLAIEQNKELSDAIVNNRKAMMEALRGIRREDYEDAEAYQAALEETTRFYQEQEAYLIGETQKTIERSKDIYNNDYLAYDDWSGQKESRATTMYGNLETAQTTSYGTMGENTDGWVAGETEAMGQLGIDIYNGVTTGKDGTKGSDALQIALGDKDTEGSFFGDTKKASDEWEADLEEIMKQAGIDIGGVKTKADEGLGANGASKSFTDFKTNVLNALYGVGGDKNNPKSGSVNGGIKAANEAMNDLKTDAIKAFGDTATEAVTWQKKFSPEINKAKDKTDKLNDSLDELLTKKAPKIDVTVDDDPAKTQLQKLIDQLGEITDKTVTITTNYKTNGQNVGGGNPQGNTPGYKIQEVKQGYKEKMYYKVNGVWYDANSLNLTNQGHTVAGEETTFKSGAKGYSANKFFEYDTSKENKNRNVPAELLARNGGTFTLYPATNPDNTISINDTDLNNKQFVVTHPYLFKGASGRTYAVVRAMGDNYGHGITKDTDYFVDIDNINKWKSKEWMAFNTGGYTGEWGPEGRLAMLHQKEIVLNAHDTENMLATVQIVRSIADQLELNARTAQQGLSGYLAAANIKSVGDTIEQNVHITAEFPNATNHSEIEEAFRNLTNLASQYAYRN